MTWRQAIAVTLVVSVVVLAALVLGDLPPAAP